MPRKTYDRDSGRRRPTALEGDAFRNLQEEMARRRPRPPLPRSATQQFEHRPDCRGSSLTTFQGSRGDLMACCQSCKALHPVTTAPEENR